MPMNYIWGIIAFLLIVLMIFGNKKVRVFSVFVRQIQVFKNAKTEKISLWDICCFVLMPVGLASIIVFYYNAVVDNNLAGILTTVFSLVFTVLFGFAAILVGKIDSKNEIEKQVVSETFISIVTATLLSLISAITSIAVTRINDFITISILSFIIYTISFVIIMLLLLITKRTFLIYNSSTDKKGK